MGLLYNAHCEGSPLLVTAGQQDRRLRMEDPVLATDLVSVARPWTKWAYEVHARRGFARYCSPRRPDRPRAADRSRVFGTAGRFANGRVQGFEFGAAAYRGPTRPSAGRMRCEKARQFWRRRRIPSFLQAAASPIIGAIAELVAVAEMLGAPVFSESGTSHGRLPFPPNHPLYAAGLPLWAPDVRKRLDGFDVALVTGTNLLRSYIYHEPGRSVPEKLRLVQLDEDPWQLGKTYPVEVGIIGDTRAGLAELARFLKEALPSGYADTARQRREQIARQQQAARSELTARIESESSARPMTPLAMMGAIAGVLPPNVAVIEEASTSCNGVLERLGAITDPTGYFGHRGWALGWGLGAPWA